MTTYESSTTGMEIRLSVRIGPNKGLQLIKYWFPRLRSNLPKKGYANPSNRKINFQGSSDICNRTMVILNLAVEGSRLGIRSAERELIMLIIPKTNQNDT
ncbi:UNVERIFIED_CONTAM: hypothetical protein PYX00_008285 [Menopon gallinae]|uniref:Ribosomal protein S10 n=1 Tax=Menopon gallinae TaxID=328185 RepID=A0AAW2HMM7_9NEOP